MMYYIHITGNLRHLTKLYDKVKEDLTTGELYINYNSLSSEYPRGKRAKVYYTETQPYNSFTYYGYFSIYVDEFEIVQALLNGYVTAYHPQYKIQKMYVYKGSVQLQKGTEEKYAEFFKDRIINGKDDKPYSEEGLTITATMATKTMLIYLDNYVIAEKIKAGRAKAKNDSIYPNEVAKDMASSNVGKVEVLDKEIEEMIKNMPTYPALRIEDIEGNN